MFNTLQQLGCVCNQLIAGSTTIYSMAPAALGTVKSNTVSQMSTQSGKQTIPVIWACALQRYYVNTQKFNKQTTQLLL